MRTAELDRILRRALAGYTPPAYPAPLGKGGRRAFLHLEGNTNLVGPNPALSRLAKTLAKMEVNQYPSEHADDLRRALAARHRVKPEQILAGNGSDEILDIITKTFLNPGDRVAFPVPSFVMYAFYGRVNLGRPAPVPLGPRFDLDVDGLLRTRAKLILVASPNNPTGNAFPRAELERLVRRAPGLVVLDEAYAEFAGQNWVPALRRHPNLIVIRTFSKAFGLAGLRIGYAIGAPDVMQRLYRAKPPYNVTGPGERIAVEALRNDAFVERSVRTIRRERPALIRGLEELGFEPFPTDANFLAARSPLAPRLLCGLLQARGILIKDLSALPLLEGCVRITIGTRAIHARLLRTLAAILKGGSADA